MPAPISIQPSARPPPTLDEKSSLDDGLPAYEQSVDARDHRACHARTRRLLLHLAVVFVLSLLGFAFYCADGGAGAVGGLMSRAAEDSTSSSGGSTFTSRKLYLIIIFVGLFLVLVFGIMLSFWCCKGSFQNPLCCPCYLCACCGGLACLECVGCGLCADAIDQA